MKVFQINTVCGYGSTGRIAVDINTILISQGHEGIIAYGRGTAPDDVKTRKIGTTLDNYFHVAKTRFTDKHGFASRKATLKLIDEIQQYDPDIIHLHNIHGYYVNIKLLFKYLSQANKPVVWTLHDCWSFTGHCSHFDHQQCSRWKTGCFECPQKNRYPKSWFLDNSKWNYNQKKALFTAVQNMTLITPSRWLADLVEQSFLKQYPVKVINNGIDLDAFQPKKSLFRTQYHLENKLIVLGVASVWDDRKGLHYFEKLSMDLDENFTVVIVGLTEKQKKQLPKNILGITRTNSVEELAEIYTAADVFVNPSVEDTFATTNIEALACGAPVITFKTGGSPECVDESCGIIIEKDNYNVLLTTIQSVKYKTISKEACLVMAQKFHKGARFLEYIDTYKTVYSK